MDGDAPVRSKNDLNPGDLRQLLARLDPDSPLGGENYVQLKRRLKMFFQSNKCTDLDDLVIEVFYRVAAKLRSEEILDLVPYCVAFAKNIVSEVQKKTWRLSSLDDLPVEGAGLADLHDHEEEIVDKIDRERMIACVRRCIAALRPDEQKLVIEYYDTYKGEQIDWRKKLAKNAGLTMETLRTRMNRLRERIEPLVKQCRKSPRQVLVSSRIGS